MGVDRPPGAILEVPNAVAANLLAFRRAAVVATQAALETREPEIETRDPEPAQTRRGRPPKNP